jgi:hypothetical protein
MVNDCLPSGKILPGHNGLAALSALPSAPVFLAKRLINHLFYLWHGPCKAGPVTARLGRGELVAEKT